MEGGRREGGKEGGKEGRKEEYHVRLQNGNPIFI